MMSEDLVVESREGRREVVSLIEYEVGGNRYPMVVSGRCSVCTSNYRTDIENAALSGYGWAAIARSLPEDAVDSKGNKLNNRQIGNHVRNGHMPMSQAVRMAIVDETAKELGFNPEEEYRSVANFLTMAKVGVQGVLDQLARGVIVPDLDQGIALANLLIKAQALAGDESKNEGYLNSMILMREAILKVCTPEQASAIGAYLQSGGTIMEPIEDGEWEEEGYPTKGESILIDEETQGN